MKQSIILLALAVVLASCGGSDSGVQGTSELATEMDSISYGAGSFLIGQLKDIGLEPVAQQLGQGLADVYADKAYITEEEGRQFVTEFQMALQQNPGPYGEDNPAPFSVDTLSYVFGTDFCRYVNSFNMKLTESAFLQGALDAESGAESLIGGPSADDQMMQALTIKIQEKQVEKNMAEGQAFIAEKSQEEGVQSTPSGLHYKVIEEGAGASPTAADQVTVHYEGRLLDGSVFDSSIARGQPASFGLSEVIAGWTEGLQLMKPGAKYQFYIPQELAYGLAGSRGGIPPAATLIFDVELISVLSQQ